MKKIILTILLGINLLNRADAVKTSITTNSQNKEELITCSICFEPIQKNFNVQPYKCTHNSFHKTCILKYMKNPNEEAIRDANGRYFIIAKDRCPLCRSEMRSSFYMNFGNVSLFNTGKTTILHTAVEGNYDLETISEIINENPDLINKQNEQGETALFIAVKNLNLEIVKLLLKNNADKDLVAVGGTSCSFFLKSLKTVPEVANTIYELLTGEKLKQNHKRKRKITINLDLDPDVDTKLLRNHSYESDNDFFI